MLGSVGKDFVAPHPEVIDYSHIKIIQDYNTATGFIFTDQDNNQITPFYAGALQFASSQKITDIQQKSSLKYAIISPNDTTAMIVHLEEAKNLGITTIFDPGQCIHFLSDEQLIYAGSLADILIMNDYERALWKEKTGLDEHHPDSSAHTIIVTLGEKGVSYRQQTNNTREHIDAISCSKVLDPT